MQITAKVFDRNENVYAVTVSGNILREDIPNVTKCLNTVLEKKAKHIILIFHDTQWLTAYFVRVLLSFLYFIRLSGGKFIIVNTHEELNRIFRAYGFGNIVDILSSEMDAFEVVYDKKNRSKVNTEFRKVIQDKIERQIQKEDALIESGELSVPDSSYDLKSPQPESQEPTTKFRSQDDLDDILEDINDFDATVEMNLVEMGLIEEDPSGATLKISKPEPKQKKDSSEISTGENPVQFLEVDKLAIDHDSDFERELKENSRRFAKESAARNSDSRKPSYKSFSEVSLRSRDQILQGSHMAGVRGISGVYGKTPFYDFMNSLPESRLQQTMMALIETVSENLESGQDLILMIDSETLRAGLSGWLIRLMESGAVTGMIVTLNAALRDFEATHGVPFKPRKEEIFKGDFTVSKELFTLFRDNCLRPGKPVQEFFEEMFLQKAGREKNSSLLLKALERGIYVAYPVIEPTSLLLGVGRREEMLESVNSCIGFATGSKEPAFLFPGNDDCTYSFFTDVLQVMANTGVRPESLTVGYFSGSEEGRFSEIISSMGLSGLHIQGDPGLNFPLFCESFLDSVNS